jgi:hypothetical protein
MAADRMVQPDNASVSITPADREALRRELVGEFQRSGLDNLPLRLLRRSPHVFWNGERPAASLPGLVPHFLRVAAERPLWLLEAIEAWLRDFAPDQPGFAETGTRVAELVLTSAHPKIQFWAQAHRRHSVFTAGEGPRRLGHALLGDSDDVRQVLDNTGMADPMRANGRFFRAAFGAMLNALPAALQTATASAAWTRAVSVLEVTKVVPDRSNRLLQERALRFDDLAGETARACLGPWLNGGAPASAPKAEIQAFLVATIGDPRLRPARWSAAGEAATRLLRGWLAAASLEAFLGLIRDHANDRQWRYREAFWRACFRKVPNAEVWVVLGRDLQKYASVVRDLNGGFGKMNDGPQAVLLMRLGNLVFSEWSNVGSLRAWEVADRNCPPLYRTKEYEMRGLKAPCLAFPNHPSYGNGGNLSSDGLRHHSTANGLWQGCAAALLQAKLGIRLTPQDYMPP